jgi:hypothetical protein
MATNTFGAFQFTLNSDNSTSVPAGMYFVAADAQINAPAEDDWQIPPTDDVLGLRRLFVSRRLSAVGSTFP